MVPSTYVRAIPWFLQALDPAASLCVHAHARPSSVTITILPVPAAGIITFFGSQSYTVCFRGQAFKLQDSERAYRSIVELHRKRNQLSHPRKVLRPLHARSGSGID